MNKHKFLLLTIFLITFFFGLFFFKDQFFFYYDQGRDAFEAYSIYHNGDLKIQGPATDMPGLYHGVGWYYFLAIPYFLGRENPFFTGIFLFFIIFLTLPVVWNLSFALFKNKYIGYGSVLLYAFSPALQLASKWLSNPSLSLVFTPFLLLVLWKFIEKQDERESFFIGMLFGLLLHANLAYILCIVSLPLIYLVFRLRLKLMEIITFAIGISLPLLSFLLVEVKFGGKGLKGFVNHFGNNSSSFSLNDFIVIFARKGSELLSLIFFRLDILLVLILIILVLIMVTKKIKTVEKKPLYFILIWMSSLILFFFFDIGISRSQFVFFPYFIPTVILSTFILDKVISNRKLFLFLLLLLVALQLKANLVFIRNKVNPYTVQKGMVLSDLKKAVDYTYLQSDKKEFVINSITSPLFINTTWSYLYEFYGAKKYGYLPYWDGSDQRGYLGNLPSGIKTNYRFTIIEPGPGIPEFFIKKIIEEENLKSNLVSEIKIGTIVVQKRIPKK